MPPRRRGIDPTQCGTAFTSTYERDQNGSPDVLEDGSRVTADNVLMLSVGVSGTGVFDVSGVEDVLVELSAGTVVGCRATVSSSAVRGRERRPPHRRGSPT